MLHLGFLGGVSEFGNNCCFIEYKDEIIIIDIGFKFCNDNYLGIRYEIPDFTYLINNKKKIKGAIITHGHLDHIGGIPFFLKKINCQIFCSSFTHYLIKKQIKNKENYKNFKIINQNFAIGSFKIEPFPVTHSIFDSLGFIIHSPLKDKTKLIFCGDLNYDKNPYIGNSNNFSFMNKYKKNPKILLLDSTNADQKGSNISESEVYLEIEKIFKEYKNKEKLIFSTFSTQIQRILEIIESSIRFKRKIIIIGKSISDNLEYIFKLKEYKKYKEYIFFSEKKIDKYKNEKISIIATGSQGEENSAVVKILNNKIKKIKISSKDLFIFSSSIIPGNEKKIFEIWNQIYYTGSEVISYIDKNIHVSGHGKIDELKKVIKKIEPDYLIPVHGEYRKLYSQKKLAIKSGIEEKNITIVNKGDIIKIGDDFKHKKIQFEKNINLKKLTLDRQDNIVDKKAIEQRKKIIQNGILIINIPNQENLNEISIKAIGISSFYGKEKNDLRKLIYQKMCNGKENRIETIIEQFFREKNISIPFFIKI